MRTDTIYIGAKPTMNYVLALTTQYAQGIEEIVVKARGRSISKAVDVVEIVRNQFIKELVIKKVSIGTEKLKEKNRDGKETGETIALSTIEIVVGR